MMLQAVGWCVVDWINMVQDRPQGRALMNIVINFEFPKIQTILRLILKIWISQEGLHWMELRVVGYSGHNYGTRNCSWWKAGRIWKTAHPGIMTSILPGQWNRAVDENATKYRIYNEAPSRLLIWNWVISKTSFSSSDKRGSAAIHLLGLRVRNLERSMDVCL